MQRQKRRWSLERVVALAAIAVGLMAGSYGMASAAGGSSSSQTSAAPSTASVANVRNAQQPWGHQRSDEALLSGDNAAKVRQLALAKVPGGTVIRLETDADGNAAYEAHMVNADGTPVTVYVNQQFEVVGVETGMQRPGAPAGASSSASA